MEKLRAMPESAVRKDIVASLQAFLDALELWRLAMRNDRVLIYILDADVKKILDKYNVLIDRDLEKNFADARFSDGMVQQKILHPLLQQVWAVALHLAARAETNAR